GGRAEGEEEPQPSSRYALGGGGPLHRDDAAVGADELALAGGALAGQRRLPFGGREPGASEDVLEDRPADELIAPVAREPQVRAVDVDVEAGAVEQRQPVAGLAGSPREQLGVFASSLHARSLIGRDHATPRSNARGRHGRPPASARSS